MPTVNTAECEVHSLSEITVETVCTGQIDKKTMFASYNYIIKKIFNPTEKLNHVHFACFAYDAMMH